uniref:xanthine dehydrogenase n=1 Tax=Cacopsylla melanoneura TaxID=428564 RepID=A0A8D8Y3K1_9HEMI
MKDKTTSTLLFFVNGKKVVDDGVDPEWTLLYYLRNKLRLCGTKLGCGEGGCGACTVMVSKYDRVKKHIVHLAVNACLAPICSMHGLAVTTVEGIGSTRTKLHPVQERLAKAHGSQCGFCTPGIIMSMYALLRSLPGKPNMKDMEVALQGNLCRCTGYRPILEGFKTFTEEWEQSRVTNGSAGLQNGACSMGKDCCKNKQTNGALEEKEELFSPSEFIPYDKSQEPIFPPELQVDDSYDREFLEVKGAQVTWYRPQTLDQLLKLKQQFPHAKIVVGNSELGVEVKFKKFLYPVLIQPSLIPELNQARVENNGVWVGGATTLNDLKCILSEQINSLPAYKTRVYVAIVEMLHWFAGNQIRNVAALGGNIMTGSPISDLNPILMAARCRLLLESQKDGTREVTMDGSFFTSYRKNVVREDEVLRAIYIPHTAETQYFKAYKQARRRDDDIAIVNAAFNVTFDKLGPGAFIKDCEFAFGGMAPTTVLAPLTRAHLLNRQWNDSLLEDTWTQLMTDLPLDASAPGGMIQYRQSLTLSLFYKYYLAISGETGVTTLSDREKSGADTFHTLPTKSSQYFQVVPSTQDKTDMVGRPIVHASAFKQATGEAIYCDDIPKYESELYLAFVLSTKPHAKLLRVDPSAALALEGVRGWVDERDVPGDRNHVGSIIHDDVIFSRDKVTCIGQPIGAVIADNQLIAQRAAQLVKVTYEDLPAILTIEEAIEHKSFFNLDPNVYQRGNVDEEFPKAQHVLEGEVSTGGQEHFYLETNVSVAVPKQEDGCLEVFVSSQHPSEIQEMIAHALDVPNNRIVARTKRLGGGFGGKEVRSFIVALPCAVAANKLGVPVRCMLDRDEDMVMTGQRNPFYGKYKVGFSDSGKLHVAEFWLYNNAGCSYDLSTAVMRRAITHATNSHYIPHVRVNAFVCKTNMASNTAFRAFGAPQALMIGETMTHEVAHYLKMDYAAFAQLNMYASGQSTHFNQTLEHCTVARCMEEVTQSGRYEQRRKECEEYNRKNRYRKRGVAIVPVTFGVAFETAFLNQAGAMVLVYTDGSVLIAHSGTEMGQGIHTKMIQVAARGLNIPVEMIYINETATDKVPNSSPTAASVGSDLNGMAILDACNKLNERLSPYKKKNPTGKWQDWVKAAFFDRVSLAATGFYKTPDIGYDPKKNQGMIFNYFCFGASVSEVEIDCLTGDHQVRATEIVMDVGESLNPAIDVGQVEGAFMQGYGMYVMEELMYSPNGFLYTRGPGTYKIPGFADIPTEFNVSLLKGAPNPRAVYSSKAVGEPPLLLASSVYFAIRDAIDAARRESGKEDYYRLDTPATPAKIRLLCEDSITVKIPNPAPGTYKPWNIAVQ